MKKLLIYEIDKSKRIIDEIEAENKCLSDYKEGYDEGYLSATKADLRTLQYILHKMENKDDENIPIGYGKGSKTPVSTSTKY